MKPKRVILCPNPYRDSELKVCRQSRDMLESLGMQASVCLPFQREGYGEELGLPMRPLQQEIRQADLLIAFGGDGGTYDIGFQSLSGAMERGHDMVYVCYDNEAYMNTGIQRSSSTPHFADTTTTPVGKVVPGKPQQKKNLTKIMVAHGVPYVAQTTFIGNFKDITEKAHKAIYTPGAAFLNVMAPCPRGWRYPSEKLMEVTKMAVETCVWPLYEVVEGKYILSYKPKNKLPVEEYLKMQGRFAHMFKPGNEWMIEEVQKEVDRNWEELLKLCEL